jgi:hypothetical protein
MPDYMRNSRTKRLIFEIIGKLPAVAVVIQTAVGTNCGINLR